MYVDVCLTLFDPELADDLAAFRGLGFSSVVDFADLEELIKKKSHMTIYHNQDI